MPSKRGDARVEHFNRGARDVPVSDKRHGVRVVRLPFQLTRERAITSPKDPTEKRGWRGSRSRFLHPLCLYNNGATFTLNGIVLAICQGNFRCTAFCGTTRTPPFAPGGDVGLPTCHVQVS